ncbi:hypothetical protein D3C87_655860 [compost metagenome]
MDTRLVYTDTRAQAFLTGLSHDFSDWRRPINSYRAYFYGEVSQQIRLAGYGASGGIARGVAWGPFAPQYVRQDGTIVPACGGIKKTHGKGQVQGKRRRNGSRITMASRMLDVKPSALLTIRHLSNSGIAIETREAWSAKQNALRQFLFYQRPKDVDKFEEITQRWANAMIRKQQRRAYGRTN